MSNIYTEHARLYLRPGLTITPPEVEALLDRVLGERGSYWVPVWYGLSAPSYLDLQYGSGKSAGLHNLEPEELSRFEEVWVRSANEGDDFDLVLEWAPELGESAYDGYPRRRPCRYGFDEVWLVLREDHRQKWRPEGLSWEETAAGLRAPCAGSYLALNERIDMEVGACARLDAGVKRTPGGFPTPTTPCHGSRPLWDMIAEGDLARLVEQGHEAILSMDLRYGGRVVHRVEWGRRQEGSTRNRRVHRSADDWDNCVDEEFVRLRGGW